MSAAPAKSPDVLARLERRDGSTLLVERIPEGVRLLVWRGDDLVSIGLSALELSAVGRAIVDAIEGMGAASPTTSKGTA